MSHDSRDEISHIASFFDEMSSTRNEIFRTNPVLDYEQRIRSALVLRMLQARPGDVVLDIGCGNARDIIPMLRQQVTVVGVDLSPGMIDQARRDLAAEGYRDVRLEVGDATKLQFPDGMFDRVICSEVIEHIPDADLAVKEIFRVLKPGGTLIVSTPNRRSWYGFDRYVLWSRLLRRRWNHPFDNWRTRRELTELLERNGFRIANEATAVYLPGFLLTYFLPAGLQGFVAKAVGVVEPVLSRIARGNGYLLAAAAVRPS